MPPRPKWTDAQVADFEQFCDKGSIHCVDQTWAKAWNVFLTNSALAQQHKDTGEGVFQKHFHQKRKDMKAAKLGIAETPKPKCECASPCASRHRNGMLTPRLHCCFPVLLPAFFSPPDNDEVTIKKPEEATVTPATTVTGKAFVQRCAEKLLGPDEAKENMPPPVDDVVIPALSCGNESVLAAATASNDPIMNSLDDLEDSTVDQKMWTPIHSMGEFRDHNMSRKLFLCVLMPSGITQSGQVRTQISQDLTRVELCLNPSGLFCDACRSHADCFPKGKESTQIKKDNHKRVSTHNEFLEATGHKPRSPLKWHANIVLPEKARADRFERKVHKVCPIAQARVSCLDVLVESSTHQEDEAHVECCDEV